MEKVRHFDLSLDGDVVMVRWAPGRSDDLEFFASAFEDLNHAIASIVVAAPDVRVLVDLRDATGRNDAEFERAVGPHRKRLFEIATNIAVLVGTQAGAMQLRRYLSQDGFDAPVFTDEDAAFEWARRPALERLTLPPRPVLSSGTLAGQR